MKKNRTKSRVKPTWAKTNYLLIFKISFLLLAISNLLSAQQYQVSGTIADGVTGEPLPGVNIIVEGTTMGVISDIQGNYKIDLPKQDAVLLFSFIGYLTERVSVAGQTTINIKLAPDIKQIDEVVVIGYGTVKKKDLTGAVSSVKGDQLKANPVSNTAQALQGKLAGVSVITQDGRPGANVSIRIRGGGSITQSNDPLIVIDGIPGGSLSDIPSDMVESIDVLKDASSTAIYGARGANGVILITTRGLKGEKGKVLVSYSGYYQSKQIAKKLEVLNAQEYILHQWSYATAYGSGAANSVAGYFGLGSANGNHYADYARINVHNYTDDMIRDAVTKDHNISITSNSEKTTIAFIANMSDDQGIKIQSGYKRYNGALKLEHELNKKVKIGFDLKYVQTQNEGRESTTNGSGSILSSAYMYRPIDQPLGDINQTTGFGNGDVNIDETYNPYTRTTDIADITYQNRFMGTGYLTWEVIKGLTIRSEISGNRNNSENQFYDNGISIIDKTATLKLTRGYAYRLTNTLNYKREFGNHEISALIGNDVSESNSTNTKLFGKEYPESFGFEDAFGKIQYVVYANPNDSIIKKQNFDFSNAKGAPTKTNSYFGRLNYSFKGRYLVTFTMRADGSSTFAPNKNWGYFPAGALAWRVSDEPFMSGTQNWLNNMKLRVSYGTSGADNIPYYAWNDLYEVGFDSYGNKTIKSKGVLPNPDLKWETTISRNLGLDFGVLNNRIYGTIELYRNSTKDLLVQIKIDPSTGYTTKFDNIANTSNKGIELSLGADIIRNANFNLGVSMTYNYNKSNIDKLADGILSEYGTDWNSTSTYPRKEFLFKEGVPIGTVQGFVSEGYYTTNDFDYNSATGQYTLKEGEPYYASTFINLGNYPNPFNVIRRDTANNPIPLNNIFPGALKIKDVSGDGMISDADITQLGEVFPQHTGGFGVNMNYKGIDFSANFTYAIGGKVYNISSLLNTIGRKDNSLGANKLAFMRDAYKVYDVNASGDLVAVTDPQALNALNANAKYHLPYYENGMTISTFLEDGSYLRLNTMTLGYTLPKKLTQKLLIQRLRVYFTGGNLITLTGYSGLDPEVNANDSKGEYPTPGLDFGAYPRSRTFTFGVNVDF